MKQTITIEDISRLLGRFIIQVDTDKPVFLNEVKKDALEFYIVKRVSFICSHEGLILKSDLFGNTFGYTKEKFVEVFNEYLGDSKGQRYHRLLTQREMDIVSDFMKSRQY